MYFTKSGLKISSLLCFIFLSVIALLFFVSVNHAHAAYSGSKPHGFYIGSMYAPDTFDVALNDNISTTPDFKDDASSVDLYFGYKGLSAGGILYIAPEIFYSDMNAKIKNNSNITILTMGPQLGVRAIAGLNLREISIYGIGGGSYMDIDIVGMTTDTNNNITSFKSRVNTEFVSIYGGGIEINFSRHLTLRTEYNRQEVDFFPATSSSNLWDIKIDVIKFGASIYF